MYTHKFGGKRLYMRVIFLLLSYFSTIYVSAQSSYTLQQCIDYALANSIELRDYDVQLREAEADVKLERNKFLPTVGAQITNGLSTGFQQVLTKEMAGKYERVNSYSNTVALSLSVPIWSADAQRVSVQLMRQNKQIVSAQKTEKVLEIKTNVVQCFYNAVLAKNRVRVAEQQLMQQDSVLNVSKRMHALGLRAKKDVLDAEMNYEQDQYSLLQEQNAYEMALLELQNVMMFDENLQISEEADSMTNFVIPLLSDACEVLYQSHPNMQEFNMQIEVAQIQQKIIRRQYYPSLSFGYESGTSGMQFLSQENTFLISQWKNNSYHGALLTLKVPIYTRGDVRAQLNKAKISEERATLLLQQARRAIYDDLSVMLTDIKQSENLRRQALKTENVANRQYAKALSDYKLGNIPSYELNVYKTKYNTARLQSVQSEITLKYKMDLLKVIFE